MNCLLLRTHSKFILIIKYLELQNNKQQIKLSQVDNIVETINFHALKYEISGIVQINPHQSSSQLMEIEEGDS
ncbi:unnamed protein product [Paramecium primaurelia]|uniref:Uncharacterized protein n=1 Tax=Paramecium primaurelia TaxID=5886 RepID=A0A8S1MA44_PARPR|nr:unnamed protein product [Paramecium primaurelia]